MSLYQHLFYTNFTQQLCSDEHFVRLMLDVELALAKAQQEQKLLPPQTVGILSAIFQKINLDFEKLKKDIPLTGNAAAPLVKQLVAAVKLKNEEAAKYIHLGATSQDIIDTATILKIKQFLNWLFTKLDDLEKALTALTQQHKETILMGRTLMQQARPITFGLKTAGWLQGIRASKKQLHFIENEVLMIQLGGAVGSQNQYLNQAVRSSFAAILGLKNVPAWHTQRSSIAGLASTLAVLTGSLAKMANDVILLSQTEIGEIFEPAAKGRGTSSTMPHKRNPVLSSSILANAHRVPFLVASILAAMPHSLQRSAGQWHSEWETLDDLIGLTAGAIEKSVELIEGLEVDKTRMLQNIERTNGLIFAETVALALAEKIGKQAAHDLIKTACQKSITTKIHLRTILEDMDLGFTSKDYDHFFQAKNAIGLSLIIVDEILENK